MIGQTISHYEITSKLGEGGMGAVYRAKDTRLGREVALKVLPEQFARDRQRMGRFQREAEILASLNHPHISMIHGLEEEGEIRVLVLELVEGPTLAERIRESPIPLEEFLRMALEIAQALETAHEKGIIHRDLKPANVKITPEGVAKVLDFGLAKAPEADLVPPELANSERLTLEETQEGLVLGTAAYMSPEQARGQAVDKRTDICSFGLVLFEMLTGKGLYAGKGLTETLAAVIHEEPRLKELPRDTPWTIRKLLERCLRKDPRMRLRDMGDARIAIQECLDGDAVTANEILVPSGALSWWQRLVPWSAVPILAVLAWVVGSDPLVSEKPVSRFQMEVDKNETLDNGFRHGVAVSPDGSHLAFVAKSRAASSKYKVYLRQLDQWETTPIEADGDLRQPFFSPDGKWLGVHWRSEDGHKLKKYPLDGGQPTTICDHNMIPFGASWGPDGTIVFAAGAGGGLWRVSDAGGEPEQITEVDEDAGETSHRLPHLLPGGKEMLFTVRRSITRDWSKAEITVQSLETGERRVLLRGASDARYVRTGHLVFVQEATLMAVPFDLPSLALTGPAVPVLERVSHSIYTFSSRSETGAAQFAFSTDGILAYIGGSVWPEFRHQVVWVDRKGQVESLGLEPAFYQFPRLSPDGSRIALNKMYKSPSVWVYDLARRGFSKQTYEGFEIFPIWAPDGESLAFASPVDGRINLLHRPVDIPGEGKLLIGSEYSQFPSSWAKDGTHLAFVSFVRNSQGESHDILILTMEGSGSTQPFAQTKFDEQYPAFSPDGRWLAYVENKDGKQQVYVRSWREPGRTFQISIDGGRAPTWAGNSRELFYQVVNKGETQKMMAVEIRSSGNGLSPGMPVFLFQGPYSSPGPIRSYDVHPDGQRFLMVQYDKTIDDLEEEFFGSRVSVVLNWFEELKRLVPTN